MGTLWNHAQEEIVDKFTNEDGTVDIGQCYESAGYLTVFIASFLIGAGEAKSASTAGEAGGKVSNVASKAAKLTETPLDELVNMGKASVDDVLRLAETPADELAKVTETPLDETVRAVTNATDDVPRLSEGVGAVSKTEVIMPNKPHTNGTEGHWETILDEVDKMVKSGEYEKIYVNKGLSNEIPNAKPNRRPDIMAVKPSGIIDQVEVPSKTDDVASLIERMIDNQRIMEDRSGKIIIRKIGGG